MKPSSIYQDSIEGFDRNRINLRLSGQSKIFYAIFAWKLENVMNNVWHETVRTFSKVHLHTTTSVVAVVGQAHLQTTTETSLITQNYPSS